MSVCSNLPPCDAMRACDTTCGDFSADDAHAGRSVRSRHRHRQKRRKGAGEWRRGGMCALLACYARDIHWIHRFTLTTRWNYSMELAFGIRLRTEYWKWFRWQCQKERKTFEPANFEHRCYTSMRIGNVRSFLYCKIRKWQSMAMPYIVSISYKFAAFHSRTKHRGRERFTPNFCTHKHTKKEDDKAKITRERTKEKAQNSNQKRIEKKRKVKQQPINISKIISII